MLEVEIGTIPIEWDLTAPDFPHHVVPFLAEAVARGVLRRQWDAEHIVFGLVPATDDIETETAGADLIHRRELLGRDDRMREGGVGRSKDRHAARCGQ